jgi:ubiquitin C-terminal hydrolase
MNSTLQCLCNIKSFVEYFKHNKRLINIVNEDTKKEKLCSSFKLLIENLIPNQNMTKKYSYSPVEFKNKISLMNPLFEGVAANDAKDLFNFLLMTLHEELNTQIANQVDNNFGDMLEDQKNKEKLFNKFIQNFAQNYRSVISDLFYAMNCNITQCGYCQKISYNYQIYFFLIFPLEEVRKYKLQNNSQFMNNNFNSFNNNMANNIVDIYDCFAYDQKINFMGGENAMYCNYCRQTCGSSMCTLLTTGPKILIIILNRGKGIEFNVKINFYPEINLNNYIENKNLNWQYELFGVITHIGESGMGGHFIAYCKEFWTNAWLKYNDALVSPVNDFKSEVIDFAMPYLLFYQIKE